MKATKINYDILVYLPSDIETIKGEKILSEDFNMGAFSIIILDDMNTKDIIKLENKIKEIESVQKVVSIADVLGTSIPKEALPDDLKDKIYKENLSLMLVTFKDGISEDSTIKAVETLRDITDQRCKISGMTSTVIDTRNLSDSEVAIYVIIAVLTLSFSTRNSTRFICGTSYNITKHRNSNFIQYGNKYNAWRNFIHNKSNKCSFAIRSNNGLCNIPIS